MESLERHKYMWLLSWLGVILSRKTRTTGKQHGGKPKTRPTCMVDMKKQNTAVGWLISYRGAVAGLTP